MQKQDALDFLKALAESEEGQKSITVVKEISTAIYRIFPGKDTALEIDKIIRPMKPASVSSGQWQVYTPGVKTAEKKTGRPLTVAPPVADDEDEEEIQDEDERLEGRPMTPADFGVTAENYNDYLGINTKEFYERFADKDAVQTLASILLVNPNQGNAKLVSEMQQAIKNFFEKADEADKNK
jgi:hypothetical protein